MTVSRAVADTTARGGKIDLLAALLERVGPDEASLVVAYLCGVLPQGRVGLGSAAVRDAHPARAAASPTLSVRDVDAAFAEIDAIEGRGAAAARRERFAALLEQATADEQRFLIGLLFGEMRQGALEGVMLEAVARAGDVPAAAVRRARMLAGELPVVAGALLRAGPGGLDAFRLQVLDPVRPMLAQPCDGLADALDRFTPAGFEHKLDGARVQVHKSGDQVRVFTRRLHDVTDAVPELVEVVRGLPAGALILDGEAIALRDDGTPYPFQVTMRRFGRRLDVEALRARLPLTTQFFDCLHADGQDLIDRRAAERFDVLAACLPEALVIPRLVTGEAEAAQAFLDAALGAGHEGIMAKALDAPYEAGARGAAWLKIKPAHTLDLVVLAAEWGHGRRRGWLSNLHLGARDPATGGFVMLGKTFKGMTDEMLAWQTSRLRELETSRSEHTVSVRPELVVEVAFNDVQASPQYPGGLALRFARLKGYRPDKSAAEADTIDTVRAIHASNPPDDTPEEQEHQPTLFD